MPSLLNESLNHILKNEASVKDDFFVYLSKFWENLFFHCFIFPKTLTKEAKNCISQIIVEFNLKKKKTSWWGKLQCLTWTGDGSANAVCYVFWCAYKNQFQYLPSVSQTEPSFLSCLLRLFTDAERTCFVKTGGVLYPQRFSKESQLSTRRDVRATSPQAGTGWAGFWQWKTRGAGAAVWTQASCQHDAQRGLTCWEASEVKEPSALSELCPIHDLLSQENQRVARNSEFL